MTIKQTSLRVRLKHWSAKVYFKLYPPAGRVILRGRSELSTIVLPGVERSG